MTATVLKSDRSTTNRRLILHKIDATPEESDNTSKK